MKQYSSPTRIGSVGAALACGTRWRGAAARAIVGSVAVAVLAAIAPARAQSVSLTPSTTTLSLSGGVIEFTADITYRGSARVRLDVSAPRGWTFEGGTSDMTGFRPFVGAQVLLTWTEGTARIGPLRSTFTLAYPAGTSAASIVPILTLNDTSRHEGQPVRFGAPSAPVIVQQPASRMAGETSAVLGIHVFAEGSEPLRYQWRKNGVSVPGATRYSLGVPARMEDSGQYDVVVSNDFGSVVSTRATLTVKRVNPGNAPPIIDVPPSDVTVAEGSAAVLRVLQFSNHVVMYQWFRDGAAVAGATNQAFVLPSTRQSDSGRYRVTLTNPYGSVTSESARVVVGAPATGLPPPRITRQPASHVINDGQEAELSVEATGDALEYQWFLLGSPILGATNATLRAHRAGSYRVVVSNSTGAAHSADATLTVNPVDLAPSTQFVGAGSVRIVSGGRGTLTAPPSGAPPHSYQWFKDDLALPGATGATLSFSNVTDAEAGPYRVVITSRLGSSQHFASVTVEPAPIAPSNVRLIRPVAARSVGSSASASAAVDGTEPFALQWFKNGRAIPGATSATLAFPVVQFDDAGSYSVVATNEAGAAASDIWNLVVTGPTLSTFGVGPMNGPAIVEQPNAQEVRQHARASFRVRAVATAGPLAYQWRRNGVAIRGATYDTYVIPQASAADEGYYAVLVSNGSGAVLSETARLTIRGRSFAGTYFGTFGGEPGAFAIHVRDDNTAVFLGHVGGRAFGAYDVGVGDDGTFSVQELAVVGAIDGVIAADGRITGAVRGRAVTLTGVRSPEAGAMESVAGFSRTLSNEQGGAADFIVDSSGRALVVAWISQRIDAAEGTIGENADFRLDTLGGTEVSGAFDVGNRTLAATLRASSGAAVTLTGANEARRPRERLANIATRGVTITEPEGAITAGFVLAGTAARPVLIRGVGPALAEFGVANPLSAAQLELLRDGVPIATNAGGNTPSAAELAAAARRVGAFPLPADSRDAAVLAVLAPGAYTTRVTGEGIALVEVYDAAEGAEEDGDRGIINLATRGRAGAGDAALIAGFVVSGDLPRRILLRGVGPGLTRFGVPDTLADPHIALFAGETLLASNDDWDAPSFTADIAAVFRAAGAFALAPRSKDAALVVRLMPGTYSVHLSGADGGSGIALVEVFDVEEP